MAVSVVCCGLTTVDMIYSVDVNPTQNQKVAAKSVRRGVGGPAANAARTAAALGAEVRLVTALGSGLLTEMARERLAGIDVVDLAPPEYEVPVSSVTLDAAGNRQVVSHNARGLTRTAPPPMLGRVDALLVDGHLMDTAIRMADGAARAGIPVIFDGGSYKPGTEELLEHVDVAAVSADFAFPRGGDTLRQVLDLGADLAIQTHGAKPVVIETVRGRKWVPVPQVDVVDTLGAGDVFHGALALAYARGDTAQAAVSYAIEIATRSVQARGALGWAE